MDMPLELGAMGVGLREPHFQEVITSLPSIGWFEAHTENFLDNAPSFGILERVRRDYPVSLHGVGLSLGSAAGLSVAHLRRVKALANQIVPVLVSEHLSWSITEGQYLNDLLPLPYTQEALDIVCRNVDQTQEVLGRAILIENPSAYLRFRHSPIPEPEFIAEVTRRTGCGFLCDINNVYVTSQNFGLDPLAYLDAVAPQTVREIHLAGHFCTSRNGRTLLIDDHGARVAAPVWDLYRYAVGRFGWVPTLIEWDRNLPDLETLLAEARLAQAHAAAGLPVTRSPCHALAS